MPEKVCSKCGQNKPLSEYYAHPQMGDGHLNKCKECTKKDSLTRHNQKVKDPNWVESEKIRAREKYFRLGYKERHKQGQDKARVSTREFRDRYPEKYRATTATRNIGKKPGNHNHHWSYNKEHYRDIIEVDFSFHAKIHRYMTYDQERMMYRRPDGSLIDSKEAAIAYYASLKDKP